MSIMVIYDQGQQFESRRYFKDKKFTILHREDGPAVEYQNYHKEWWVNGKLHRLEGPAIEYTGSNNAISRFFINGEEYSKESYWEEVDKIKKFGSFV